MFEKIALNWQIPGTDQFFEINDQFTLNFREYQVLLFDYTVRKTIFQRMDISLILIILVSAC